MVLDIGAKATNLVFVEGNRLFTRSIPVAGNAITQEIAKGLDIDFADAEEYKCNAGFVALGGTYAVTDDEKADRVSKMVRNVVTRLHAEVNRSVNFYRSQQGGGIPAKVLLTGGTSMLPYLDTFFREKMQVEVEFFNPFINVAVADKIAMASEAEKRHLLQLGGVVGLALRKTARCPVEINLLPHELEARKDFFRRLPYFILSIVGVVLAMVCWYLYAQQMEQTYNEQKKTVEEKLKGIADHDKVIKDVIAKQKGYENRINTLRVMAQNRYRYAEALDFIGNEVMPGMWLMKIVPDKSDKSTPDSDGFDILRLEGIAYEDSLRANYRVDHGAHGLDRFYSNLVDEERRPRSPFFRPERGAGVIKTTPLPNAVLRDFVIELRLRTPLGGSALAMDEDTSEGGK